MFQGQISYGDFILTETMWCADRQCGGRPMLAEFLIVVFGTGAILAMAGYAALCERI
jgi:hypothetical protein